MKGNRDAVDLWERGRGNGGKRVCVWYVLYERRRRILKTKGKENKAPIYAV